MELGNRTNIDYSLENLFLNKYIQRKMDLDYLAFLLYPPDLFSQTGYKVLQSQEEKGFVKCRKICQNGIDKLVYSIEGLLSLDKLVSEISVEVCVTILKNFLDVLLKTKANGFLSSDNIPLGFENIFVDCKNFKVTLVYLPINSKSTTKSVGSLDSKVKSMIVNGIQGNELLQTSPLSKIGENIKNPGFTIEFLKRFLNEIELQGMSDTSSGQQIHNHTAYPEQGQTNNINYGIDQIVPASFVNSDSVAYPYGQEEKEGNSLSYSQNNRGNQMYTQNASQNFPSIQQTNRNHFQDSVNNQTKTSIQNSIPYKPQRIIQNNVETSDFSNQLYGNLDMSKEDNTKVSVFKKLFSGSKKEKNRKDPVNSQKGKDLQIHLIDEGQGGATQILDDVFIPAMLLMGIKTPCKVELPITKSIFLLGKKEGEVDGLLNFNSAISRVHCKIAFVDGKYYIEDLGSVNGTYLNGTKIGKSQRLEIKVGDSIRLANTNFTLKPI